MITNPEIKTKVIHSQSKNAWNVVGETLGRKYKIARIPYYLIDNEVLDTIAKSEALEHAEFISYCFNNAEQIINNIK